MGVAEDSLRLRYVGLFGWPCAPMGGGDLIALPALQLGGFNGWALGIARLI